MLTVIGQTYLYSGRLVAGQTVAVAAVAVRISQLVVQIADLVYLSKVLVFLHQTFGKKKMSDRIHFGSLEAKERREGKGAILIEQFHKKEMEIEIDHMESIDTAEMNKDKHQVLIDQLERKKIANQVAVPTEDTKVRNWLRQLFEPITLFGEGNFERRQRLKDLIAIQVQNEQELDFESSTDEEQDKEQEFYTYGLKDLIETRKYILDYSIKQY
jgi:U4/U6 small nuclear ribonucleoprotein PRP4